MYSKKRALIFRTTEPASDAAARRRVPFYIWHDSRHIDIMDELFETREGQVCLFREFVGPGKNPGYQTPSEET